MNKKNVLIIFIWILLLITQSFIVTSTNNPLSNGTWGLQVTTDTVETPYQTGEAPYNGSENVSRTPTLYVIVRDNTTNDKMNVTWYSNSSGSWVQFASDSTIANNTNISQSATNFTDYSTTYWWSVNLSDTSSNWYNRTYHLTTLANTTVINNPLSSGTWGIQVTVNTRPTITVENPSNGSTNQPLSLTWSCYISDINGDTFNWNITCSNGQSNSANGAGNGTKSLSISNLLGSHTYTIWVNVTDSHGAIIREYHTFSTLASTVNTISSGIWGIKNQIVYYEWGDWSDWWVMSMPVEDFAPPTSFTTSTFNDTAINLSWTKNSNATHTYITRKLGSYPDNRSDGTNIYNDTGTSYDDTGLNIGSHYYYRAWSYNSTVNSFTVSYSSTNGYTKPGTPEDLHDTNSGLITIDFEWTKGVNATNSVIIMNETGYTNYPNSITNGTSKYNNTGSSTQITGLSANTTYYFSIWSYNPASNFNSPSYVSDDATTLASADSPYNLAAGTYNATQLNLSWTKSNINHSTVIRRKTGGYPTLSTGTEIYNGTASTYKDTGLTPATKYYYRAWGWNGETLSTGYAQITGITRPEPPYDFTGNIQDNQLVITWTKGTGAWTTLIRNDTGQYPATTSSGTQQYNGSGTQTIVNGTSSIDYYRGWSYAEVNGTPIYSLPTNLLWGGLEINVYKEDQPWIAIGNYTVFITNNDATETYLNTSQNNPFRIDVGDVPNGEDITIQITKQGYKTRTQVMNLLENTYYTINFYLAASSEGSPPSEVGEPWYVNASDITNETTSSHYIITVKNELETYIENAYVIIQRYVNATANDSDYDSYDTVLSDYTDSSGQVEVDLIPDTVYYVTISKTGYKTMNTFWTPSEISYVEDAYKTFIIEFTESEYENETVWYDFITFNGYLNGNILYINYTDTSSNTTDTAIVVYENNQSQGIILAIYWNNKTGNNSFQLNVSDVNGSSCFTVDVFINHSRFGFVHTSFTVCGGRNITSSTRFDSLFTLNFGYNPFGWSNTFMFIILCITMFSFGQRFAGLSMMLCGGILLFINTVIGLSLLQVGVPILLLIVSVLIIWGEQRKEDNG